MKNRTKTVIALFWFSFTLIFVSTNMANADVEKIEVPITAGKHVNPNICEKEVVGGRVVFENIIEHGPFNCGNTTYFVKGEHLYLIAIGMQRSEKKVFYRCSKYSLN